MRELPTEKLRQVLHLYLMDLLNVKPGSARGNNKRPGSVGSHLLFQHHLLLLSDGRFSICLGGHGVINVVLFFGIYFIDVNIFRREYGHFLFIYNNATRRSVYDLERIVALFGALSIACLAKVVYFDRVY